MKLLVLFFSSILLFFSCTDPNILTETKIDNVDNVWVQRADMSFPIEIEDASATYQIFYQLRYDSDYPYYNLWVNRYLYDADGNQLSKKMQGMELFHASSGEPYGAGFGNYFDYKIMSDSLYRFPHAGKYTIKIEQYMRTDTLKGISSVGLQVIKNAK